jgi:NADH-quinone oxidoreductase subunit N
MTLSSLAPLGAEVFLLCAACAILLADQFLGAARRMLSYWLTVGTLVVCALITAGLGPGTAGVEGRMFMGMFIADPLAFALKLFTYAAMLVCLIYSRAYLDERGLLRGDYLVLSLFSMLGMMVMISAGNFIAVYLGLELMSLCLYALVAFNRDSAQSTEAAMKYFVLGALSSGLLLYGMSMLYGATGSLDIARVAAAIAAGGVDPTVLVFGLVFVVAGLAFKLGLVPFHMWIPDVYHGAPNAMTLLIGAAPKIAGFAMVLRVLVGGLIGLATQWQQMLLLLAVGSLLVGNLAAIAQTNIKRMLAYSTISHMGFVALGLLAGVSGGAACCTRDAYSASMFYVITYVIMTLGAFGVVLLLSRAGFEADQLEDYRGLNQRHPGYALVMMLMMFSLAGIPPTVGFYSKLSILQAIVQIHQLPLAVFAVVMSMVGAFYYLRVVKLMYFDTPAEMAPIRAPIDMRLLLGLNALAVLALGIMPSGLMGVCVNAISALMSGGA